MLIAERGCGVLLIKGALLGVSFQLTPLWPVIASGLHDPAKLSEDVMIMGSLEDEPGAVNCQTAAETLILTPICQYDCAGASGSNPGVVFFSAMLSSTLFKEKSVLGQQQPDLMILMWYHSFLKTALVTTIATVSIWV